MHRFRENPAQDYRPGWRRASPVYRIGQCGGGLLASGLGCDGYQFGITAFATFE